MFWTLNLFKQSDLTSKDLSVNSYEQQHKRDNKIGGREKGEGGRVEEEEEEEE